MEIFFELETYIALITLTFLEIVLGVDNIIFISIVSNKVDKEFRQRIRTIGLFLAMILRIIMLLGLTWFIGLTEPIFETTNVFDTGINLSVSWKDIILAAGGIFLILKSSMEITHKIDSNFDTNPSKSLSVSSLYTVVWQIVAIDFIFSVDSILTAIGLTEQILLMIIAVVISIIVMMVYASKISNIIERYPSLEILALSFLILIGFNLIVEAAHYSIPKGYIYFALFFTLGVEYINIIFRNVSKKKIKIKE